jgi:hypothetical protein
LVAINPGDDAAVTGASGASSSSHTGVSITTESLTTAAGSVYTETLTNADIYANSIVLAQAGYGTATTGTPVVVSVVPAAGSVVIKVLNAHASAAFNGTLVINVVAL